MTIIPEAHTSYDKVQCQESDHDWEFIGDRSGYDFYSKRQCRRCGAVVPTNIYGGGFVSPDWSRWQV